MKDLAATVVCCQGRNAMHLACLLAMVDHFVEYRCFPLRTGFRLVHAQIVSFWTLGTAVTGPALGHRP